MFFFLFTSRLLPPQICALSHLLLVFPLGVQASLDAFPGLLEGLPLGALSGVMGAHSHNVGTGEDQNVGHYLQRQQDRERVRAQRRSFQRS